MSANKRARQRPFYFSGRLLGPLFFIGSAWSSQDVLTDKLFAALQRQQADDPAITQALNSSEIDDVLLALRVLGNIGGEPSRAALINALDDENGMVQSRAASMIALAKLTDVEALLIAHWRASDQSPFRNTLIRALGDRGGDDAQAQILAHLLYADNLSDLRDREAAYQAAAFAAGTLWRTRRAQLTIVDKTLVNKLLLLTENRERSAYLAALAVVAIRHDADLLSSYDLEQSFKRATHPMARAMSLRAMAPRIKERGTQAFLLPLALESRRPSAMLQWQSLQAFSAFLPIAEGQQFIRDNTALLDRDAATHLLSPWRGRGKQLISALEDLQRLSDADGEFSSALAPLLDEIQYGDRQIDSTPAKFVEVSNDGSWRRRFYALQTERQTLLLALNLDSTPYAAHYFVELVQKGFFNQLRFRDVVPGVYAQTGVYNNDSVNQTGFTWPAERDYQAVMPGAVGFVSAGKRLNGSQLFISLGDNPHLDGRFTLFATIACWQAFVPGEKIVSARLASFDEQQAAIKNCHRPK